MNICLFGASSQKIDKTYVDAVFSLGAEIARRGHTLYFGGGARGLMGAAARGAASCSGKIVGIAPRLFDADGVLFDGCSEMIFTDTLAERKKIMYKNADAFVAVPGGIGTLDELFEVLTIRQLGLSAKPTVLYNTNGFFDPLMSFIRASISEGFIIEEALSLFCSFAESGELLDHLESEIKKAAFRRYKE